MPAQHKKLDKTLTGLALKELDKHRSSARKVSREIEQLFSLRPKLKAPSTHKVQSAMGRIPLQGEQIFEQLNNLKALKLHKQNTFRQFRADHGIERQAKHPDVMQTGLILAACILSEGLPTALLMVSSGEMDLAMSISTALTVSAVNIVLATMTGYFPGRYLHYKIHAPIPEDDDEQVRKFAWAGLALSVVITAILHFFAARVRALGTHEGILDFSYTGMGLFETFNDANSFYILILGWAGSILAYYKGYLGLSDPIPGYSEVDKETKKGLEPQAAEIYEDALSRLDDLFDSAKDELEDALEEATEAFERYRKTVLSLNQKIHLHNDAVQASLERLLALQHEELLDRQFIEQQELHPEPINREAFEALYFEPLTVPEPVALEETQAPDALLDELETVYHDTVASVQAAYSHFLTDAPPSTYRYQRKETTNNE
jgi:hypothetical protein